MSWILRHLPFFAEDTIAFVGEEMVRVKAYEIIVWVSLGPRGILEGQSLARFPAILDIAHTRNFSIQQDQLARWTRLSLSQLPIVGAVRQQGRRLPLHAANLWLHPNKPGQRDQWANRPPYRLRLPEGLAIYPAGEQFPRLPLLGLRLIARNKLRLTVDGERQRVSLRPPRPSWWPFG
jgi:hypothetical protein